MLIDTLGDVAAALGLRDIEPGNDFAAVLANAVDVTGLLRVAHLPGEQVDSVVINGLAAMVTAGHRIVIDTGTNYETRHRIASVHPTRLIIMRPYYSLYDAVTLSRSRPITCSSFENRTAHSPTTTSAGAGAASHPHCS